MQQANRNDAGSLPRLRGKRRDDFAGGDPAVLLMAVAGVIAGTDVAAAV